MKTLSVKVVALATVALLALLGLAVLSVLQGRYDMLLVGLIGVVAVSLGFTIRHTQVVQAAQLKRVAAKVDQLTELARGIPRLEETQASSPRLLDGSQERQVAETAARFDWLARRHLEQAEQLDGFLTQLEATIAQQHQDVLAQLQPPRGGTAATAATQVGDGEGTVGSPS